MNGFDLYFLFRQDLQDLIEFLICRFPEETGKIQSALRRKIFSAIYSISFYILVYIMNLKFSYICKLFYVLVNNDEIS